MRKNPVLFILQFLLFCIAFTSAQEKEPISLLSSALMREIVNEASGELAFQNEIILCGVNRNRQPEEYQKGYFEVNFIVSKLHEYGIPEVEVVDLPPSRKTVWDAESAELWLVKPEFKKIADLKEIAACLAPGSSSVDLEAELVYVGPGDQEEYYQGKEVKGKIVLVNGPPEMARRLAVEKFGAAGLVCWSSSHPEFDRDQVGWNSIRLGEKDTPTFAFMLSERQGQTLRDMLERGQKVLMRARVKTQLVPDYKEQMVSALIPGTKYPEQELVFVAHLFEGFAMQGANDNMSGCVAILETARVLARLMADRKIPAIERSVRFLFVPEISGSNAYLKKYPEIKNRMYACINLDMVGEGLIKHQSYFRLYQTPWSLPTYLNDCLAVFVEWMARTQEAAQESGWRRGGILAPTGSRDPFYYKIEGYTGGSDHVVFIDGSNRIPSVLLNVWPDQWYHTSGDTIDKSDPTQLKRTVVITTAAALFLANAGPAEAEQLLTEVSTRGLRRLATDKGRAESYLFEAQGKNIHEAFKEARTLLRQATLREKEAISSVNFFLAEAKNKNEIVNHRLISIDDAYRLWIVELNRLYQSLCRRLNEAPAASRLSSEEIRLSRLVPLRTEITGGFSSLRQFREEIARLGYKIPPEIMAVEWEMRNFIDGRRTIVDIRDAVSAEFSPVNLKDVASWFEAAEKVGLVKLKKI